MHPPHNLSYSSYFLSSIILSFLSLFSGQWMMLDWRTERWWTLVPLPNVQFLSGICLFHISNADTLCLICSFPQPHEDDLLNCWINPSSIYIYKNVTVITLHSNWTHLLTLTICSTHVISSDWVLRMARGKLSIYAQFTSQWGPNTSIQRMIWELRVKLYSISNPRRKRDWTLPGHTDLSWTDCGHYCGVNWAIYITDH